MQKTAKKTKPFRKASSLTEWLSVKYGITYKQYRNKSKKSRTELKEECMRDTGIELLTDEERGRAMKEEETYAYALLAEFGVPFSPTGEPLGIG